MKKISIHLLVVAMITTLMFAVCYVCFAEPQGEPRKIVMPSSKKLPLKYKCPEHGVIEVLLQFNIEEKQAVFCKRCAMKFVIDVFELNLPKLEVINENAKLE